MSVGWSAKLIKGGSVLAPAVVQTLYNVTVGVELRAEPEEGTLNLPINQQETEHDLTGVS